LISTAWVVQGVYTATKLGIIDAVYRLMRLLAGRDLHTALRWPVRTRADG
jgi:hypothetical protein